jgi:hypothetical protein
MKTMILKELKWNLKWALAGFGVYAVCLAALLLANHSDRVAIYEHSLDYDIQKVTLIGFPAFGLLLGFLQVFFESRRDSWAFLVHRPLSRRGIFWSKVIVGLILYFAAILIPSALFLLWLLQPGGLPVPFEWGVLLSPLSDLMAGVVYYFAGLLVGLRQARWYGSRLWPILAAILVSFLLLCLGIWPTDFGETSIPLQRVLFPIWLLIFAVSITLALAAYGAFQTGGTFSQQPRACKWGLALCLAIAGSIVFCVCWLFLGATVGAIILSFEHRTSLSMEEKYVVTRNPVKPRSSEMKVTKDGRVVTVVSEDINAPEWHRNIVSILDQSGKPMEEFKNYVGKRVDDFEAETITLIFLDSILWGTSEPYRYREPEAFFDRAWADKEETICWIFYPRHGRFFGYSRLKQHGAPSYTPLGSAGPDGFQPPSAPSRFRFPAPTWGGSAPFYRSESDIYWIDFQSNQVQHVFSAPKGEPIVRSGDHPVRLVRYSSMRGASVIPVEPEKQKDIYLVTSGNHIVFINRDKGVLADISLSGILEPADVMYVGRVLDRRLYFVQTREKMIAFSEDGRIQAQYKLPNADLSQSWGPLANMFDTWTPENTWQMASYCWNQVALPVSVPPALLLGWNGTQYAEYQYLLSTYGHHLPLTSKGLRKMFLVQFWYDFGSCLAGALLALLFCNRRLRKYPFSRGEKTTWRLLMLLMGPGALFALYALYDWPAKEPCPACGKMRVVNREHCEFCGALFTPPAPTGKEIFEKDE